MVSASPGSCLWGYVCIPDSSWASTKTSSDGLSFTYKNRDFEGGSVTERPILKVGVTKRIASVADPDPQIRGGGGHPDSEIRGGGGGFQKPFFSDLRASVWSRNKGGPGPPGPFPRSATVVSMPLFLVICRLDKLSGIV